MKMLPEYIKVNYLCSKCGNKVKEEDERCKHCGTKLREND